jgi:hypothetical protein
LSPGRCNPFFCEDVKEVGEVCQVGYRTDDGTVWY